MVYEHILITDNSDKTMKKAAHYFNWELSCAVQAFRNLRPQADGICLVYNAGAWRFIGYLWEIIA